MNYNTLQRIDFIDSYGNPTSGLVPIHDTDFAIQHIDEKAAVLNAATLFNDIDYIFFRRFSDGRSSQISAYIVDNHDKRLNDEALAKLHHQVWLHGAAPLLYVAGSSSIDILSCARKPDFWKDKDGELQYNPAKSLDAGAFKTAEKINKELARFSAFRLADGTFWDEPANQSLTNYAKAAHQSLINAIIELDKDLQGEDNPVLRRLLLLMVLIKYLEDRKVFPKKNLFGRYHRGARNFLDVLRGGKPKEVCNLLDFLERKFSGDIFKFDKYKLTRKILEHFADLVEGKTEQCQRQFWKLYNFEHLPVEIISHLYQHFVRGGHGAVYTPPFMAALLLDQAMPYNELTGKEIVLDPACGSGIFLVGAYRRLINVWRSKNKWQRPTVKTLKNILKHSIFGTELDTNAIDLTAFSLSLAVCDALQPDVIWNQLHFDPLRKSNLFEGDFFDELLKFQHGESSILTNGFDVVIGNPPFKSKLSVAGAKVNRNAQEQDKSRGALPDNQIAYLFLEQSFTILRKGGTLCLIQPVGMLYGRHTTSFCNSIFSRHRIDTVFDFVSIRNLYETADTKTIAILAKAMEPLKNHYIQHWTFRRTISVHNRICFELDHYDRHNVSQKQATSDSYVWRINLFGGGRLNNISQRLRDMRTLEEFIDSQNGWDYGEGFIAGKTGRREPAPFLTGKRLLPNKAFTDSGINESELCTVKEELFRSAYSKKRYSSPLLLIKKIESLPVALSNKKFLAYRSEITGIHAPKSQVKKLKTLYDILSDKHEIYKAYCILHSKRSIVVKSTAYFKYDIDMLPYPENIEELSFSFWEHAMLKDIVTHISDYVRNGQKSELLATSATTKEMSKYSDTFIKMLGSVYDNLHATKPIIFNGLICQPFYFGECPNLKWVVEQDEEILKNLIHDDNHYAFKRTNRILRY